MKINVVIDDNLKQDGDSLILTDANGKQIKTSIFDMVDVSKFSSKDISKIGDNEKQKLLNFKPTITDSEGVELTDSDLLGSVKSGEAIALDVTFEATHSGDNLNHAVYTSKSLEEDTQTWMYPFAKPLIKNHDMEEEPIGRTIDANFGASEFAVNRDCINVTYRVSDEDAMVKFADGRYKTMSIGARSGYIRCNTCGKDILKDGQLKFCGHWKGDTYAGKKATWTVENMTFREGSVVNAPADVYAQVKSIKVVKKEGNPMSKQKDNQKEDDILAQMDGMLNNGEGTEPTQKDNEPTGTEPTTDPTPENKDGEGTEPTGTTQTEDGEKGLQGQLDAANEKIADLENHIQTLTTDKEAVDTKLAEAQTQLSDKESELSIVVTDNEGLKVKVDTVKDQAKRMAEFNLKLMKDNLKDLNPNVSDAELEGKRAKDINDMIQDLRKSQTRQASSKQTVTSPGLGINDKNTVADNEDENKSSDEPKKTMKDMEEVFTNVWSKH